MILYKQGKGNNPKTGTGNSEAKASNAEQEVPSKGVSSES